MKIHVKMGRGEGVNSLFFSPFLCWPTMSLYTNKLHFYSGPAISYLTWEKTKAVCLGWYTTLLQYHILIKKRLLGEDGNRIL